jgi:hypothetical protein
MPMAAPPRRSPIVGRERAVGTFFECMALDCESWGEPGRGRTHGCIARGRTTASVLITKRPPNSLSFSRSAPVDPCNPAIHPHVRLLEPASAVDVICCRTSLNGRQFTTSDRRHRHERRKPKEKARRPDHLSR